MTSSDSSTDDDEIIVAVGLEVTQLTTKSDSWSGRKPGSRPNINRGMCSWYRDYLCFIIPTKQLRLAMAESFRTDPRQKWSSLNWKKATNRETFPVALEV